MNPKSLFRYTEFPVKTDIICLCISSLFTDAKIHLNLQLQMSNFGHDNHKRNRMTDFSRSFKNGHESYIYNVYSIKLASSDLSPPPASSVVL